MARGTDYPTYDLRRIGFHAGGIDERTVARWLLGMPGMQPAVCRRIAQSMIDLGYAEIRDGNLVRKPAPTTAAYHTHDPEGA